MVHADGDLENQLYEALHPTPKRSTGSQLAEISLYLAGIGVIGYGLVSFLGATWGATDTCSQTAAELQARSIVRSELHTPSTASFGRRDITRGAGCTFNVRGTVDAQNGFGATVRHNYSVTVRYDSEADRWVRL